MISDIEIELETKRLMFTHKFIDLYHDGWLVCKVCKLQAVVFNHKISPVYENGFISCDENILKSIL